MRIRPKALGALCSTLLCCAPLVSEGGEDAVGAIDPPTRFKTLCAPCHGERRYGGYAPPLIPATLERKNDGALADTILHGRPNTQMQGFGQAIGREEANALVAYLRQPVGDITWSLADIAASRVEEPPAEGRIAPDVPREELILVVERGTGSVSVLEGATLQELDRFHVGRIHGGVKFDRDFHQAVATTRDGTVVDYDLDRGVARTRVKAGVNTRNVAISSDGAYIAVANQLPQGLVVFDGRLRPLRLFPLPGQPSAVYQLPGHDRFFLTLRDLPHLYTVSYPALEIERITLDAPFEDFVFVPGRPQMVASARDGRRLVLYDYEKNRVRAELAIEGLPHLFSASYFEREGRLHAAFNHMGTPRLSIVRMDDFEIVREIPLLGSGYFTRTHAGTPYLFVDSNTEAIQMVDKASLELLDRTLVPEPGKKAMHVEFTADGRTALVSVWHAQGAVVAYDSNGLEELRRLPYAMPVGKYNAANKTRALR